MSNTMTAPAVGSTVTVTFEINAKDKDLVKANSINGVKSKKIILVDAQTYTGAARPK